MIDYVLPIVLPVICGVMLLVLGVPQKRSNLLLLVSVAMTAVLGIDVLLLTKVSGVRLNLFELTHNVAISFALDRIGTIFYVLILVVWCLVMIFSFEYMKHEQNEKRYYGFFFIVLGVLTGLCFAGNLITFYAFFELLTLTSMPLVLHNQSHEAVMAGLKYLFYSFAGAYLALLGLYFLFQYGNTLDFTAGGVLNEQMAAQHQPLLLVLALLMILGFGVKAGMFPMHAWLPTAHPVAPAPASAFLSAIIVKAGVLALIRVVYYIFGVSFLRGTWVQTTWMILALLTVFMGSMLAYREKILKKRLAYSTVSQVSYILFGLSLMEPVAFSGAIYHVIAHGLIKSTLFLCAGAIIYQTGKIRVEELNGIGKQMPVTIWCYTIASLGLIGIPPTSGFISKWYLASGALNSGNPVFAWLGPVILLISALLTAGYLLPSTMHGFFPGEAFDYKAMKKAEPCKKMVIPLLILTALSVISGVFTSPLLAQLQMIADTIF